MPDHDSNGRRSIIACLLGFLALLTACGVVLAIFIFWQVDVPQRAFEAGEWRGVDRMQHSESNVRQSMVTDLLENRLVFGSSQESVETLLGPPTYRDEIAAGVEDSYWLGPGRKLVIDLDSEWLVLRFTANGSSSALADVRVVRF